MFFLQSYSVNLLLIAVSRIGAEVRKYRKTPKDFGASVRVLIRNWKETLDKYEAGNSSSDELVHEISDTFREDLEGDGDENLSYEWLKVGLAFESEDKAIQLLDDWSYKNKIALVKAVR